MQQRQTPERPLQPKPTLLGVSGTCLLENQTCWAPGSTASPKAGVRITGLAFCHHPESPVAQLQAIDLLLQASRPALQQAAGMVADDCRQCTLVLPYCNSGLQAAEQCTKHAADNSAGQCFVDAPRRENITHLCIAWAGSRQRAARLGCKDGRLKGRPWQACMRRL